MKAMIRKITERIRNFLNKSNSVTYRKAYEEAYKKAKAEVEAEYKERVYRMRETIDNIEKISDINAAELEDLRVRVDALSGLREERIIQ